MHFVLLFDNSFSLRTQTMGWSEKSHKRYVVESEEDSVTEVVSSVEGGSIDANALPEADDWDESSDENSREDSGEDNGEDSREDSRKDSKEDSERDSG